MENINKIFSMKFKKYSIFIVSAFFLVIIGLFLTSQNIFLRKTTGDDIKYVKIAGQIVKVDLALTKKDQEKGLSGRENIKENEGMLFIFSKPQRNYFWMKDMNFPIDMIWINDDLKVIYIKKGAQPSSYPNSFGPGVDNRYVLEVFDGFSEKNNLEVGNRVEFLR